MENATRTKHTSYCGTPADVWDYRTAGPLGERVVATQWKADRADQPYAGGITKPVTTGQIDLLHCKGDGRKASFQHFATTTVFTREQADAWAAERLS